ncbi:MAG: hypothetical protein ABJA82_09500 [Myxococcales bacterium]
MREAPPVARWGPAGRTGREAVMPPAAVPVVSVTLFLDGPAELAARLRSVAVG